MNQNDNSKPEDNGARNPAEPEAPEAPEAEAAAAEAGGEDAPASEDPTAALAAAEAQIAELQDRLLRVMAEQENLRRRTEREKQDIRKYAIADFARDLLGVADNLQRAREAVPHEALEQRPELKPLLDGIELTERELLGQFEKHGIRRIEPHGEKLNPNLHQAMMQVDHPEAEAGTIVQVLQIGYTLHDRLLRAAMVGVATGNNGGAAGSGEAGNPDGTGKSVDTKA